MFYTNTPTEEVEVVNEAVVPLDAALRAVREFFASQEIPRSVEWAEL